LGKFSDRKKRKGPNQNVSRFLFGALLQQYMLRKGDSIGRRKFYQKRRERLSMGNPLERGIG